MKIKITCVYNNTALTEMNFKGDWGSSYVIESEDQKIMYDTGARGEILLHNMKQAGIDPNEINSLVFSHGHDDHTGGLKAFVSARTFSTPLLIIAHPNAFERKKLRFPASFSFKAKYIGVPVLPEHLKNKISFQFVEIPHKITSYLSTVGEINQRTEKDGTSFFLTHEENGKWKKDPLRDDLSLALHTKEGIVLICGCCHAGILNTCSQISDDCPSMKISAIIGGTHMLMFSKKKIDHLADVLRNEYDSPKLYLNHCTGKKAINRLKKRFGSDIVLSCHAGTELVFAN